MLGGLGMATDFPIRILSDLHMAHRASLIRGPEQAAPLLDGAAGVIFNGDTAELRYPQVREQAAAMVSGLRELCERLGTEPVFLNGNHDPDISGQDFASPANGGVLVFHGHSLFSNITPWGRDSAILETLHGEELAKRGNPAEWTLASRLEAARMACLRLEPAQSRDQPPRRGWLRHLVKDFGLPHRAWPVLQSWRKAPALAAEFADRFQPAARAVVIGHTHFPGHWLKSGLTVVNTGSFLPGPGRRLVELDRGELRVRKIHRKRKRFYPGDILLRVDIATKPPSPTHSTNR